jgi:uncharacterized membrane protein
MKSIILGLSILFYFNVQSETLYIVTTPQETPKIKAFNVLITKCNVCHASKKKQDVFTLENMDSLAVEINKQVFIKAKMPKGKKNKLSNEESQAMQNWLNTILIQ